MAIKSDVHAYNIVPPDLAQSIVGTHVQMGPRNATAGHCVAIDVNVFGRKPDIFGQILKIAQLMLILISFCIPATG